MNEVQVIGSHNSYKVAIEPGILQILATQDSAQAVYLDYQHISVIDQLDLGLRSLEFDVFYDPEGGKYSNPMGLALLKQQGVTPQPFDPEGVLNQPGMKMFHVQDIDFRSHHLLLKDGLEAIKKWSNTHPDHMPVFITVNTKDEVLPNPGFNEPLPFDKQALDDLDKELADVLGDKLITPDQIRGDFNSLEKAILTNGWPALNEVKGKFMFILDQRGQKMQDYVAGHPALKGRKMFTIPDEGTPESGVRILNNAKEDQQKIKQLIEKGYIVRTRADANTIEARTNDYSSFEAAKKSGAQIISTDYYQEDTKIGTGYKVQFEGGIFFRKNPFF
jgi:hypothetical protein